MSHWTIYESPLGPLTLRGGPGGLTALDFPGHGAPLDEARRAPAAFAEASHQLDAYFAGRRQRFELALDLGGTPFQRAVWERLLAIPYAGTVSYSALARAMGRPDRVRAVAAAVGRTPVPIIVPCHRAVAIDGALTGYRGGLQRKQALLDLERHGAAGLEPPPVWAGKQLALV
ncbi:MAG: methylated-DNA-[protein]-cysteine S-methyltransferase [Solirubrobacteraceae bacterium]|jgi:methylated-DNA-[protein]-cysteine S-methyltransferase|nr:methylated-DNA-[protein]-cysteine S-methyltransferase [Solirubrobacteraceae bacterium]